MYNHFFLRCEVDNLPNPILIFVKTPYFIFIITIPTGMVQGFIKSNLQIHFIYIFNIGTHVHFATYLRRKVPDPCHRTGRRRTHAPRHRVPRRRAFRRPTF